MSDSGGYSQLGAQGLLARERQELAGQLLATLNPFSAASISACLKSPTVNY
jgi:hypothetical protein